MSLAPGSRLGPYEILSALGAGGMGEVYRARDTKLDRDVAIKVLPEAFASDPERIARFQREAKTLASLNHPHIAAIYGIEESAGAHALIMELVEGEDLSQRIARGRIPLDEALPIAKQIAEALEAAHEQSIIHRDLKPANIKVRPDGTVKVLDFGLAKLTEAARTDASDASMSPTITSPAMMTGVGVLLGTAAYMSPEQAKGKPADKRSDAWAFGCVLFEMLTGRSAFAGDETTEVLASVLAREPDWAGLPAQTPQSIRILLRRCLRRERRQRLSDAGAVRIEIEDALATPTPSTAAVVDPRHNWPFLALALVMLLSAFITGVALWSRKPVPTGAVVRTVVILPPGEQLASGALPVIAVSPDGRYLVYVADRAGTSQLFLRAMDAFESKLVPGTEGASSPFVSPDSQWVGFFAGGKLKKVSINGSTPVTIADAINPRGASWDEQGAIVFAPTNASGFIRVADTGGQSQALPGGGVGRWPEVLPSSSAMLFEVGGRIATRVLETGQQQNLIEGTNARYTPSGHLVYAQSGNLMAVPFDPKQLRTSGTAVAVVKGVLQYTSTGAAQYSLSRTGTLVYVSGDVLTIQSKLTWVSRSGVEQPLNAAPQPYGRPRIAPDGRIALTFNGHVWVYDPSRDTLTRTTFEGSSNNFPLWTRDGRRMVFNSNKEGLLNLFWRLSDGSGSIERIGTSEYTQAAMSWSPDDQFLAITEIRPATGYDVWVVRLSDHHAQPFLQSPFTEGAPQFSPDGRWMAYCSDESGRFEIYVQAFPGPGGKWQITTEGGTEPMWNPNGRELFYRNGNAMMAVDIATQSGVTAGKPRVLFEGAYVPSPFPNINYDVSSDGERFLMLKPIEGETTLTQINVVQHWTEELKRLVPTK